MEVVMVAFAISISFAGLMLVLGMSANRITTSLERIADALEKMNEK